MAQATAVATPAATTTNATLEDIAISVFVDAYDQISVSRPFVSIPNDAHGRTITWTLTHAQDVEVTWDNPALSLFGEGAVMEVETVLPNQRRVTWYNIVQGRSYCYRIHLLKRTGTGPEDYLPLTFDPIIHNDPPP